jgi:hypothetical protein
MADVGFALRRTRSNEVIFADHTFIVSEATNHGMQVFDVTQLRGVTSAPVTFTATAHYAGFGSTHTLAMNNCTGFA